MRRAGYAANLSANGVISSPHEAAIIHAKFPKLEICTPGIRPAGSDKGDQNRIATPADAVRAGANYLVIGRPITQAKNPAETAKEIIKSID